MNLLIVNDEILTAETMKEEILWENYGIQDVFTAYNVEDAKACILRESIDVMLCDIEMPGENGLSLLRWVREERKNVECVFLTCHAKFAYAQEAISLGCRDYILIPAEYQNIGEAIKKVVDRIKQEQSNARYQEYGKNMLKENLKQEESKEESIPIPELVEKLIASIMKQICDTELSVDRLAEQFHFHPVYLNRIFKKEKGISLSQYIINERMKMAAGMLELGNLGPNRIAEKVGYSHYTNFYNMFKKYYGMSPAQYQEEHKV